MSFIRRHILDKIKKDINRKQDSINFNGFFYFDDPILDRSEGKTLINRANRYSFFEKNGSDPLIRNKLSGTTLLNIYFKIKNNDFFFYKVVNNKSHKIRFKK